jgi:hypothetical protein
MKKSASLLVICALSIIGYYGSESFFNQSYGMLRMDKVILKDTSNNNDLYKPIVMAVILGLLPLCFLLVQKTTDLKTRFHRVVSALIIILSGLVFWRLRIYGLNSEFQILSEYNTLYNLPATLDRSYLKFEVYLLMGFIVGTLIAILIFRDKSRPLMY